MFKQVIAITIEDLQTLQSQNAADMKSGNKQETQEKQELIITTVMMKTKLSY